MRRNKLAGGNRFCWEMVSFFVSLFGFCFSISGSSCLYWSLLDDKSERSEKLGIKNMDVVDGRVCNREAVRDL